LSSEIDSWVLIIAKLFSRSYHISRGMTSTKFVASNSFISSFQINAEPGSTTAVVIADLYLLKFSSSNNTGHYE
jgi:hypothetical protein